MGNVIIRKKHSVYTIRTGACRAGRSVMNEGNFIKKLTSLLLAIVMVFSIYSINSKSYVASAFNDISGHWAESYINEAVSQGFIKGYPDGSFKPDAQVSRAEFVSMINRALENSGSASISFSDVSRGDWYYEDVAKAVRASYVLGYNDSTFRPGRSITRQEACVMISKFVPTYGESGRLQNFPDYRSIASWAYTAMSKVNGKGYIGGYADGKIHPLDNLTRAQAAKIISEIIDEEKIVSSDTVVRKDGTKLSGTIYSNDVTIDEDLGDDSALIENCVILGSLNVQGGGDDTITVNNSRIAKALVDKSDSSVRLLAKGETTIAKTEGSEDFILQTSSLAGGDYGAGFEKIGISGSAQAALRGSFPYVSIDGSYANVKLETGTINELYVSSDGRRSDITVESGATVKTAKVYAESYFHGEGTISNMLVYARGITYETKPRSWTIGTGGSTPTQTEPELSMKFNPQNAETGVYLDTKITIKFNTAMRKYNGNAITASDIKDIVTLRKGSSTGATVDYSATINTAKDLITITPSSNLSSNTKYYIQVEEDTMRDEYGNYNDSESSYFTTGDATEKLTVTFSPANGATGVPIDTDSFTITFSDRVVKYDGSSITSSTDRYLRDSVVVFQEGGKAVSTSSYAVSISSTRRVITVTPDFNLSLNTRYYLGIKSNTLKTEGGTAVTSAGATWTTAGAPALSSISAAPHQNSIDFKVTPSVNGTVYAVAVDTGAVAPDAAAIKNGKDGSGNAAAAFASSGVTAANAKTLSLSGLETDTQYKIYAVLYDGSGNVSNVASVTETTMPLLLKSLTIVPVIDGGKNVLAGFEPEKTAYNNIYVPFGTDAVDVTAAANADLFVGTISINGKASTATVRVPLVNGKVTITVNIQETGKSPVIYTVTLIEAGSADLDSMTINGDSYNPGTSYRLESYDTTSVVVNIVPEDSDATILIDGYQIENGEDTTLNMSVATTSISFRIRSSDGSLTKSYAINFTRPPAPEQ